jgi:hypothetical protein
VLLLDHAGQHVLIAFIAQKTMTDIISFILVAVPSAAGALPFWSIPAIYVAIGLLQVFFNPELLEGRFENLKKIFKTLKEDRDAGDPNANRSFFNTLGTTTLTAWRVGILTVIYKRLKDINTLENIKNTPIWKGLVIWKTDNVRGMATALNSALNKFYTWRNNGMGNSLDDFFKMDNWVPKEINWAVEKFETGACTQLAHHE